MQLRSLFTFTLCIFLSSIAWSQIDPSSVLLLNRGNTNSSDSTIDSGRYTIRPRDPNRREEPRPIAGKKTNRGDEASDDKNDDTTDPAPPVTVTVPGAPEQQNVAPRSTSAPLREENEESVAKHEAEPERIAPPREMSRRYNLVELSFAPGYLYSDSSSEYFFRRYSMAAPVLNVEANVWLSPYFALNGGYMATMSGHVNDSLSGDRNVPATHEWFTAGFRFREFFGRDALASAVTLGIDYYDYRFRVPSDAEYRQKLASVGARISLESEVPVNIYRSWVFGIAFSPKLQHREEETATDAKSGGHVDANAVTLTIGGRMQFERKSGIFWRVSHTVEKEVYSGEASVDDPRTAVKPTGVAVINSITLFLFGYTWGN